MDTMVTEEQFWRGLSILVNNYHALNKKIFQCLIISVQLVSNDIEKLKETHAAAFNETHDVHWKDVSVNELQEHGLQSADVRRDNAGYRIVYKLLTKKQTDNINAVGIVGEYVLRASSLEYILRFFVVKYKLLSNIDFAKRIYICRFQSEQLDDFAVQWLKVDNNDDTATDECGGRLEFSVLSQRQANVEQSERWVEYVLKTKLLKWCQSAVAAANAPTKAITKSLQLVDVEQYNNLYKELKQRHSQELLKLWQAAQESTDPLKFIYEDLAIAAYLISLWRNNGNAASGKPCVFADLGCGNGLLVYILYAEGYAGYGYDIRARKLWSHYPAQLKLSELSINPDDFKLPVDVNWLIGNHSDELSPWLPMLAATASYDMCYFLLPCCAYEFSGAKFQRRNTRISAYQDFLNYTQHISKQCGFVTLMDRLKIPSTKRLALVGMERIYTRAEHAERIKTLQQFVLDERLRYTTTTSSSSITETDTNGAAATIKLREKNEAVRNCTQVDRKVLDALVLKIFTFLLNAGANANNDATAWSAGGQQSMRQIVEMLSRDELKNIKSECGGIKTLLRNRHEIFEFRGGDLIGIRYPRTMAMLQAQLKSLGDVRKRLCFFKVNHPQGCPLSDAECSFSHNIST